ncbi:MAG: hypothetical protein HRU15_11815 [Planctomycetes bacterium]|nr:hypothetical protein [Planctomycetota bacterium]
MKSLFPPKVEEWIQDYAIELIAIIFGGTFYLLSVYFFESVYWVGLIWASPFILMLIYIVILKLVDYFFPKYTETVLIIQILSFYLPLLVACIYALYLNPFMLALWFFTAIGALPMPVLIFMYLTGRGGD